MNICFDCSSGVSGDMIVGALLDLGADKDDLLDALKSLNLNNYQIKITKLDKKGVACTDFDVVLKENNFDHDMRFLYGDKKANIDITEKRTLKDVKNLLKKSKLTSKAQKIAESIFEIVAESEAKAHGVKREEVVFHENGAMDSIIDITSIAFCLDNLHIEKVFVKNLCEGHRKIRTRIGFLEIPTPAVKNILQKFGIKLKKIDFEGELITPTGLAALASVAKFEDVQSQLVKTGFGAGKRNYELSCVLRVDEIL